LTKSRIPVKFSLMVIIISLIFLGFVAIFQFQFLKKSLESDNKEFESLLVKRVKYEFIQVIWDYDKNSSKKLITAELGNKVIKSIRIRDESRNIIWMSRNGDEINFETAEPYGKQIKKLIIPIKFLDEPDNKIIGYLDIWLDYESIYKEFIGKFAINIIIMIVIILIIVITVLIASIVKLANPLDSLRKKMIEAGNYIQKNENIDTAIRVSKNAFSEIKEMYHELDTMISRINTSSNELKKINIHLEDLVKIRTDELSGSNDRLIVLNRNLEKAYEDLKTTQNHLIDSEKMIILGNLVSGIAHELNTPLGAIISSNNTMKKTIESYKNIIIDYSDLDEKSKTLFLYLLNIVYDIDDRINDFSEDRARKKLYLKTFESCGLKDPDKYVDMLLDLGFSESEEKLKEILTVPEVLKIINDIYRISSYIKSISLIKIASEKAAIVVKALKIYSYQGQIDKKIKSDIAKDIEIILTLYHNKIKHGVEIIRKFGNIPEKHYYPERLNIVWSNIINNAIQAMNYKGKLEIDIEYKDEVIIVSFIDNGPGIPEEIKDKIFLPFFTTKKPGEGTGLGLDITKRILDEVGGNIYFESMPGNTKFSVYLKTEGKNL
jgi:signal transduction histidine kinase